MTTTTTAVLSLEESKRFVELENIVQRGLGNFMAVGKALMDIRDARLYRIEFNTWEEYLQTRWEFSRSYACRLICAAREAETLPTGNIPKTEHEARKHRAERKRAAEATVDADTGKALPQPAEERGEPETPDVEEPDETPHVRSADEEWKDAGVSIEALVNTIASEIVAMRDREILVTAAGDCERLAKEHERSAALLRS